MADFLTAADSDRILLRFLSNVRRARRLSEVAATGQATPDITDDMFRSSVVFLHAATEDVLRSVGRLRLPTADGDVLAAIPLVGLSGLGEDRKFTLRHLARHRALTVDDLIYQSVRSYLDRKSFSSASDVVEFLKRMEIDTRPLQPHLSDLERLMARRHRIVHQADLVADTGIAPTAWTTAEMADLTRLVRSVVLFGTEVIRLSVEAGERTSWAAKLPSLTTGLV